MFSQSIMSEILYLVSRLRDRKKVEVIRHFPFRHECIANLRNCILNIDQLEKKQAQISGGSTV